MTARLDQLPETETRCANCGLRVRVSVGVLTWPSPDNMCTKGSWQRCPNLDLAKARADARKVCVQSGGALSSCTFN